MAPSFLLLTSHTRGSCTHRPLHQRATTITNQPTTQRPPWRSAAQDSVATRAAVPLAARVLAVPPMPRARPAERSVPQVLAAVGLEGHPPGALLAIRRAPVRLGCLDLALLPPGPSASLLGERFPTPRVVLLDYQGPAVVLLALPTLEAHLDKTIVCRRLG